MKFRFTLALCLGLASSLAAQTEFSQERALEHLRKLSVEIGPRPMGSPAERRAMQYAIAKFREYGCDTAYIMEMPVSRRANTTSGIAVGIRYGETKKIIVLGGHIDSEGPEVPGADDDGSGSATVIELSRVLCKRRMHSTFAFCCWGGEEQGLEGSTYFVNNFEHLDSVSLMLQVDMANGTGLIELDPDANGASAPRWLTRAAIDEFYGLGYSGLRYPTHYFSLNYSIAQGSGSDHEPFLQNGIPAIDFSTDVGKPIHTPRDNFDNFEPGGLQRSGDVLLRLSERFDRGIPSRSTDQYWLLLLGRTPIFVSYSWIGAFVAFSAFMGIVAFLSVRRRREPPGLPGRIRWSGSKMVLYAFLVVICGWFSSDVIGVIRGVRFPWLIDIPSYSLLAFLGASVGIWIAIRLSGRRSGILKLSLCPYVFGKRAILMLLCFIPLLGLISVKLMVEPAVGLLLVSLSILFRNSFLKILMAMLAPIWMVRLIFSEWSPLLFRLTANSLSGGIGTWLILNGSMIFLCAMVILPFMFALASVVRDSRSLGILVRPLRSFAVLGLILAAFTSLGAYLLTQPVNDRYWYKNVTIAETFDMNAGSTEVVLRGSEYLSDVRVKTPAGDTTISSRTLIATLAHQARFDTTWLDIRRSIDDTKNGDTTLHTIILTLAMTRRPFTVSVVYRSSNHTTPRVASTWRTSVEQGSMIMRWFSFPDSILRIPVSFTTVGSEKVTERVEATFDALAAPVQVEREMTDFFPRTSFVQEFVYKN